MILQGNVYSSALDMETTVCFVAANNFSKEPPRKICYLLHGLQGRADNFILGHKMRPPTRQGWAPLCVYLVCTQ